MHHIAIATNNLQAMFEFYSVLPGLELKQINRRKIEISDETSGTSQAPGNSQVDNQKHVPSQNQFQDQNFTSTIQKIDWDENLIRSVWFSFVNNPLLIMIEKENFKKGSHALVFALKELDLDSKTSNKILELEESRSEYSIYFSDPDGNKLGYSSFPTPLKKIGL
ncbi:hypothetical protein [Leptospira sp. GIMC2001]|uniref:hypothetical protein n=1 Tax=Leptospira sp. GIMC2001 TaxID=1513297 RepID=UPI00234AAC71|nr:hypothetical protein [Leptospira sp. GIMC2001]WCL49083.1 hypothetical protein O4O04_17605 [Leptospira sp. GIMC2001]